MPSQSPVSRSPKRGHSSSIPLHDDAATPLDHRRLQLAHELQSLHFSISISLLLVSLVAESVHTVVFSSSRMRTSVRAVRDQRPSLLDSPVPGVLVQEHGAGSYQVLMISSEATPDAENFVEWREFDLWGSF